MNGPDPRSATLRPARSLAGRAPRLGILMVASEVSPWAKTGGLADVLGALPAALASLGHHVTVVMPKYRGVAIVPDAVRTVDLRLGRLSTAVRVETLRVSARHQVAFVDSPAHFDRAGIYGTKAGEFSDNAERFAVLCMAALEYGEHATGGPVDIVHAHDWQAGLAPSLLALLPQRWPQMARAARVTTIHNLAYQGTFPKQVVPDLGLPWAAFTIGGGEFWGQFSFLKAGINHADLVTTVSPAYARETLGLEHGCGFEGVLGGRADRYLGILNGIDTSVWDPRTDPHLAAPFSAEDLRGKRENKRAVLAKLGLPVGDDALERPLIGMISRLVGQKGIDLVRAASESLSGLDASWVFLGSGEASYEEFFRDWASRFPTRVAGLIGFDEPLAHLIEAGADMFLMPSRYEPCGLNQMYSLRYGTVPIVTAVGGLDDTIQPYTARAKKANGFKFKELTPEALVRTVRQAIGVYRDPAAWHQLIRQGMADDHSWAHSAREYGRVYRRARFEAARRAAGSSPS